MNRPITERALWGVVVVFAAAMAWVEAACVYYLRLLVDRVQPYQPDPLPIVGGLGNVELVREATTLLMLLTTGMLAGRTWQRRVGYAAIAFGVWDVLYYVFLWIMSDWPASPLDWDILFLLPLPWWGPVLAPVSIALLLVAWGTLATQWPDRAAAARLTPPLWVSASIGIALALGVFMADALVALPQGRDAVTRVLPTAFNWPVFGVALLLMAAPVAHLGWRLVSSPAGATTVIVDSSR
jgi:hypothetical protein